MMNRTLLEMVSCVLLEAKNSEDFLAEALAIATLTYIINKSLSISINLNTSEEIWRGTPPDLSNLCTYTKQSKVEPGALKHILKGYLEGVKGYK